MEGKWTSAHLIEPVPSCRVDGLSYAAQNLQARQVVLLDMLVSSADEGPDKCRSRVELSDLPTHCSISMVL